MTSFWQRLKYYLIGFTVGLIFVIFFFQNRGCSWLPGNRVKNTFLDKVLVLPSNEADRLAKAGLKTDDIVTFLNMGDVMFTESIKEINTYPKVYVIKHTINEREHAMQFALYEDSFISVVRYLEDGELPQAEPNLEGLGYFVRIPRDSGMVFIDKSTYLQCKSSPLGITDPEKIAKQLRETGQIDFSRSNLMLPKAEHHLIYCENDSTTIEGKAIWFESRIAFKDFYWEEKLKCE
jgi:hypothetical protein